MLKLTSKPDLTGNENKNLKKLFKIQQNSDY
jgi:hypothetical protein